MASASTSPKGVGNLTLDKAAFLLIRIKRIFVKKKNKARSHLDKAPSKKKPPLLRARTLPAIICPSLNIIQAQLEADVTRDTSQDIHGRAEGKPRRHFSGSSAKQPKTLEFDREHDYLDPDFEPAKSPLGSPRASVTSVTSSTSTQSAGKESSKQKYEITKAGLARLAKRLTSKEKSSTNKTVQQFPSIIPNIEVTPLRRSGSVDSLMGTNLYSIDASDISNCSSMACLVPSCSSTNLSPTNLSPTGSLTVPTDGRTIPTSPSVPAKLEAHRRGDLPSSPSVPNKLTKGLYGQDLETPEVLLDGLPLSKTERKRLEKLNKVNIDLQALFVAVEHQHLERVRSLLSSTDVNVNSVNKDGFTPLDIAVMTLDISMVQLLQAYGARETTKFRTKESKRNQLISLLKESERYVEDLTSYVLNAAANGSLSVALVKEKEKQLSYWSRKKDLLSRMKTGFDQLEIPDPLSSVSIDVVGTKSLKVRYVPNASFREPETVVTKYKVEWSVRPDFHPLSGSRETVNLQRLEIVLNDLIHGVPYHVRVAAGNSIGYSSYTTANPPSAAPSSWMDISGKKSRAFGRLCQLDYVFHQIIFTRPPCSSEIKDIIFGNTLETPQQQRRQVKKSIKNLFTPTPKFQKYMKRGVYLACLIYTDHRILVTTEDTLPIMEVDDSCPSCLHNDFHWLMKVACTWEDTKALRLEMEKTQSSSSLHFRCKLLQAAEMMQAALGVQDLGQFYYKPIKDLDDTTVLCTVKYVPDSKSFNNLSLRWVPLAKLQRKLSISNVTSQDVFTVNCLLPSASQAIMAYNHVSKIPLSRGLYVAYVKISSSVDLIRILVPKKAPNVLPYYKVRDNPHVSSEEWLWLKSQATESRINPSPAQLKFQKILSSAIRNLLAVLEIFPEQVGEHRLYDNEVVELNPEVSLLLLLPPVDSLCSVPGQKDDITERTDCVLLPLQIFEMIHMSTYQHSFISRYSRVSSILEMDTVVAQHVHRQAFSTSELASAKSRLRQLQQFQTQVDNTWRSMRWLMDVLNFARDKHSTGGILLSNFVIEKPDSSPSSSPSQSPQHSQSIHTLQVPTDLPGLKKFPRPTPSIRVTNSSSSFSLTEASSPPEDLTHFTTSEMRRCASTSGLMLSASSSEDTRTCTLQPFVDKAYSSETLTVSYNMDSPSDKCDSVVCTGTTPVNEDEQLDANKNEDGSVSQEGIVMKLEPSGQSCNSLSSNEATNPDIDDFDDDISDYKEQQIDALLHLPQDDSRDHPSEDEDSLTDCGLQFKPIPKGEDDPSETDEDDYEFVSSILDTADDEVDSEEDELQIFLAYSENIPEGMNIKLKLNSEATVHEIVQAVTSKVNEIILEGNADSEMYISDQILDDISLVVEHGTTERYLNDSFQPLKVQNPWTKGKLLIKRRQDA
ncbi:ankyrin repeat and fibronectin type-III domain-containing protein 1-like isoform X2 [Parasteatoda tepidariorum]